MGGQYGADNIYVSFSGGKDSTVLLNIARQVYPNILAVYVDTGLEYPEIRQFVKTVENVEWLKPEMNFRRVIQTYGYPLVSKEVSKKIYYYRKNPNGWTAKYFSGNEGRYDISRWKFLRDSDIPVGSQCCEQMKERPLRKFYTKTKKQPIIGTMASESQRRTISWLRLGCNAFEGKNTRSTPLAFWTEQDVLEYLHRFDIPYASVYGQIEQNDNGKYYTTGAQRTGCMFCGFGAHLEKEPNRFQKLKETHPKIYDYVMRPIDDGGLGMKEPLEFVGVKTE